MDKAAVRMRTRFTGWTALLLLLAAGSAYAITGKQVLDRALAANAGVKDYICTLVVKSNIPNVRLPERKMTVYMKRPDKVRIDSGGQMAMVPRDVLLLGNFARHLRDDAQVILAGQGKSGGRPVYFLKIVPKPGQRAPSGPPPGASPRQGRQGPPGWHGGQPGKLLVWVWGDTWTVKHSEIWEGQLRRLSVDWAYKKVSGFWLPSRIRTEFTGGPSQEGKKGTVELTFSNWRVNTGLADSIFPARPQGPTGSGYGQGRRHHEWQK